VNQVSIQYDLYGRIKEAQQGDYGVMRILEKIRDEKTQGLTCDKGMVKIGHRVCVYHKMQDLRGNYCWLEGPSL